jgi:hypothetical protein
LFRRAEWQRLELGARHERHWPVSRYSLHISPAVPWLRFRGHLGNISDNMFTGAINGFTEPAGSTLNQLSGERDVAEPKVARAHKADGQRWVVVGDENHREGSRRERARCRHRPPRRQASDPTARANQMQNLRFAGRSASGCL